MEEVLQTVREMLLSGERSEARVIEHPGFENFQPIPFYLLAPYTCLMILRHESREEDYLKHVLDKLQSYVDFDMRRKSSISAETANNIHDACDQTDVVSVVEAVCKLTETQLNIIGV